MDYNERIVRRAFRRGPYSSACVKTHNRPPIIEVYVEDQTSEDRLSNRNQCTSAVVPESPCQSGRLTRLMVTSYEERCSTASSVDSLNTCIVCEPESDHEVQNQSDHLSICSFTDSDFLSNDGHDDFDEERCSTAFSDDSLKTFIVCEPESNMVNEHAIGTVLNQNDHLSICSFTDSDFLSEDGHCSFDEDRSEPTLPASVSPLKEEPDVVLSVQPLGKLLDKEPQRTDTQEESLTGVKNAMEHRQKKHGGCFRWIGKWLSRRKEEEMTGTGRTDQKTGALILLKTGDIKDRLPELEGRNEEVPCPLTPPSHTLASWPTMESMPPPNRARLAPITNVSEKGKKLLLEIAKDSQQLGQTKPTVKEIKKAKKNRKQNEIGIEKQQEKPVVAKVKRHIKDKISLRKRFLQWLLPMMCCMRK